MLLLLLSLHFRFLMLQSLNLYVLPPGRRVEWPPGWLPALHSLDVCSKLTTVTSQGVLAVAGLGKGQLPGPGQWYTWELPWVGDGVGGMGQRKVFSCGRRQTDRASVYQCPCCQEVAPMTSGGCILSAQESFWKTVHTYSSEISVHVIAVGLSSPLYCKETAQSHPDQRAPYPWDRALTQPGQSAASLGLLPWSLGKDALSSPLTS